MKIFDVISLDDPYGLERQFYNYLCREKKLEQSPPEHTVAVRRHLHDHFRDIEQFSDLFRIKYFLHFLRMPKFLRPRYVCREINRVNPDLVMFHSFHKPDYLDLLHSRIDRPKIFHEQGLIWHRNVDYSSYRKMNHFVANSHATKTMLTQKAGVSPEDITVIFNSYPPEWENNDPVFAQKGKGSSEGSFRCVYVGRLEPFKGVHSLLLAAEKLQDRDCEFHVVGDGSSKENLEELVEERSINNVHFHGYLDDPKPEIKKSDLMVVPSVREPFGKVNLEAGLLGTPLVCSAVDGINDVVPGDEFGYPIEPTVDPKEVPHLDESGLPEQVVNGQGDLTSPKFLDPEKLVDRIRSVMVDPAEARRRAENFHERIRTKFSPDRYVRDMQDLYRKVIA